MAMQAGMGFSKIIILVGAGYTGTLLLNNGKLSDILGDIQSLVKGYKNNGEDGESDAIATQESRIAQEITAIEKDTGFKLRVLAHNYPDTPGLSIKDYWQADDRTIIFVADPTFGNILNFNVGDLVDLDIPRSFWSRLAGKYGNMFYWKEKGEDASIEAAVMAISN